MNSFLKYLLIPLLMVVSEMNAGAQTPRSSDPALDAELARLLNFSVPLISVKELQRQLDKVVILDAREKAEYDVSHIPGAKFLGFEELEVNRLSQVAKDDPIVVYCSVGYRSEKAGERLKSMGYSKVFNLYGSIFEWANQGFPLENGNGQPANELHTYNEEWSRWVKNPKVKKVW